jgi:hypothetical protein
MLAHDDDIAARAITRIHTTIKNASDLTRHVGRRALLEEYQAKQAEIRRFAGRVRNKGSAIAAINLQVFDERIKELEANEDARIASHVAMIVAMAELGGTEKLQQYYKQYSRIRDHLARQGALPSTFSNSVRPILKK